jgi:long-chain acyl-CoA synthetase
MSEKSLIGWFAEHAEREPKRPYVIAADENRSVSYGYALQLANSIVACLRSLGLARGDRIVFSAENHWLYLPLLAACAHSDIALLPLNPDLRRTEIELILDTVQPKLVITDSLPSGATVPVECLSIAEFLGNLPSVTEPAQALYRPAGITDPCLLIYTSGSSGNAKIVMLTEAALVADGARIAQTYEISAHDRLYCVLPFHHMNAMTITGCAPLVAGATVVLGPLFGAENAKTFWRSVSEFGVTIVSLVPSIMGVLLMADPNGGEARVERLRLAFCGAAPLSADLWRKFEGTFGIPVFQGYGLTETTCWAVATPPDRPRVYSAVGVPFRDCEVEIDLESTAEVLFGDQRGSATGTVIGEILLRGPILMAGYLGDGRLTGQAIREDGFLRTGDMGFIDDTGQLHVVARKKEIIIKNGRNIVPDEVDAILNRHPSVVETKTIGVPHHLVGEQVVSAVRLAVGATTKVSELRGFVKDHLAAYKCPDRYVIVGVLPKSSTGKIAVMELRERLSGAAVETRIREVNTWKYKRAQPSDLSAVRALMTRSALWGKDMSFVAYWGCGQRHQTNEIDRMAMDRMTEYISRASFPPAAARLTLVLTDLHAEINGKPAGRVSDYFAAVADDARVRGIETVFLSDLWRAIGLRLDDLEPAGEDHPLIETAYARAAKHSENLGARLSARRYLAACRWDSQAMLARFPESVFLTYNGPSDAGFLPNMPTFYIYSYRKKVSKKPWFHEELTSTDNASAERLHNDLR